jgi:hypothetical protein
MALMSPDSTPESVQGQLPMDSIPDLAIAKRLLDSLKLCGFDFRRSCPGEDGPLVGHRISGDRVDLVLIEGFSRDCFAWRQLSVSGHPR